MRKGGGKGKGSAFERKVCTMLSLWISKGAHEDLLWRSAISGGRATQAAKQGKALRRQAGDISAVSAEGCALTDLFFLECKHYRDLNIASFILRRQGTLAGHWRKTIKQAKQHGKAPVLIAMQNRFPAFVVTRPNAFTPIEPIATIGTWCEIILLDDLLRCDFANEVLH